MSSGSMTRGGFLAAAGALLLFPAGCGAGAEDERRGSAGGGGARRVKHEYGSTKVSGTPRRVVSLGYTDQDPLLALGVTPVAVRYWFGDRHDAIFPWAEERVRGKSPRVLNMPFGELDFEKIAALDPDLILAVSAGLTHKEYETLSRIAPTIPQPDGYVDFGTPWQKATLMTGEALDREERARRLVSGLEQRFRRIRRRHPVFDGSTVAVAVYGTGEKIGFLSSQDIRARFFTGLGFRVPRELDRLARGKFYGYISTERMDLLDADLLVWTQVSSTRGGRSRIERDPLVRKLNASREGRMLFLDGELDDALQFGTVLSLPLLLRELPPDIAAVVDGDPKPEREPEKTTGKGGVR